MLNMGVLIVGFGVLNHAIYKIQKENTKSNKMRKRMVQRESEKAKRDQLNRLWWNKMKLFYDSNVLFWSRNTRIKICQFSHTEHEALPYHDVEDKFIVDAFVNKKITRFCNQMVVDRHKTSWECKKTAMVVMNLSERAHINLVLFETMLLLPELNQIVSSYVL